MPLVWGSRCCCECAGEEDRLWREAILSWRTGFEGRGIGTEVVDTEAEPAIAVWLRVLAFEAVRWCRRELLDGTAGVEKAAPERRWVSAGASVVLDADVEDALETTEAFWATRRSCSSRVRRFT